MDINIAIEILSLIAQIYATILSIVSGFFLVAVEYFKHKEKEKERFEEKQLDIIKSVEIEDSFTYFSIVNALEIILSLVFMWLIGLSTFTSEELNIVILGLIVFAVSGLFGVYHFIMKIIKGITTRVWLNPPTTSES